MLDAELKAHVAAMEARNAQREKQQGLGRPIISEVFQGYRLVFVGNRAHYSKSWRTFHDFLFYYITSVFGKTWGATELAKPKEERHPLLNLSEQVTQLKRRYGGKPGLVQSAPMTGAASAYLGLAYNLYLLAHNATLQARLVARLKEPTQFHGAFYETYAAAAFIKAGFAVEPEAEDDPSTSHCEFVAEHPTTKRKLSVEAKARLAGKTHAGVGSQLYKALKKHASHERVVFIDVNREFRRGVGEDPHQILPWLAEALASIRAKEARLTVAGAPAPPAYVVLTSHPYVDKLDDHDPGTAFVGEGFKIGDFKLDSEFQSVRDARIARERHREMYDLFASMGRHYEIPMTFDGEIPEFAFGAAGPRLLIGQRYAIPAENGEVQPGILETAAVLEKESQVLGFYRLNDGRLVSATCPITADELSAYRRHPDTFFGRIQRLGRQARDVLDLYDFFFESYGQNSKENLLRLMAEHPDAGGLAELVREELAVMYCERMAAAAFQLSTQERPGGS